jgi:hypothetical protein
VEKVIRSEVTEQAQKFNGRNYPLRLTTEEKQSLKDAGLVVIYPHGDDCAEVEGAITDEAGVFDGGVLLLAKEGVINSTFYGFEQYIEERSKQLVDYLEPDQFLSYAERFCQDVRSAVKINAIWDEGGYSWQYKLSIPHATFDLMENGEIMAKCVVFHVDDMGGGSDD